MAKNGIAKGLDDILLQGLADGSNASAGSSKREERQQLREEERQDRLAERQEAREARQEAREARQDEPDAATDPALTAAKKGDAGGGLGGLNPAIEALVANGGSGNDTLTGTDTPDVLDGFEGNDVLLGLGDADTLYGSSGLDTIFGGSGADFIVGGLGNDTAFGGLDNDNIIDGGSGVLFNGPDQTVNGSNSLVDVLSFVTPLSDGSGGYVVGWGQGVGLSPNPQAVFVQRYDNAGNQVGGPIRFDTAVTGGGGPNLNFQDKGEVQLIALQGANAGKFAGVFFSYNAGIIPEDDHNAFLVIFNANGTIQGWAQLSPAVEFTQSRPTVTAMPDGNVIVAWQDQWRDTGGAGPEGWGIYAQRYNVPVLAGNPTANGADTHVSNNEGAGNQALPQSITLSNGNVVFLWDSDRGVAGGQTDVFIRIYNSALNAQTGPLLVGSQVAGGSNPGTQFAHYKNMAVLNDNVGQGSFIVVWSGAGQGGGDGNGIFFRRFNNDGTAIDNLDRQANDTTGTAETWASVTALADGGFFIVWQGADAAGQGIFGQRFDINGNEVGSQIQINSIISGNQQQPTVTTLSNGTIVVTWDGQEGGDSGVFQRLIRFGSNGGDDVFHGEQGNDFIQGESGNDQLFGGEGTDSLDGGTSADILTGGSGVDSLFGGLGSDVARYADSAAAVNVNLNDNLTEAGGEAQGDFITGVEHLVGSANNDSLTGIGTLQAGQEAFAIHNSIVGGLGNDNIFGLEGNDSLFGDFLPAFAAGGGIDSMFGGLGNDVMFGGDGSDFMVGGAGADTMSGDTGTDAVDYSASTSAVDVRLSDVAAESGGDAQGDVLTGFETLFGSNHNDTLQGNANASVSDLIVGGNDNDMFLWSLGLDSLVGGLGSDTVNYSNKGTGVFVDLTTGAQFDFIPVDPGDTLFEIENVIGSESNDTLIGSAAVNSLFGGSGNDYLRGGAGGDRLEGGVGNDAASYSGTDTGVIVNLAAGTGTNGDAQGDVLVQIETVFGSSANDTLIGDGLANALFGNNGDDTLEGGVGADTLDGGANVNGDFANYSSSSAAVTVDLANVATESGGDAQGDSLVGIEHVFGSSFADVLTGDANRNSLVGRAGNDTLFGLDGDDLLLGDLAAGGVSGADSLFGGTGNDQLDGLDGNDTLHGGAGADALGGGSGQDWVSWLGSAARVDVNLTVATQSGGDAQGDTLSGVEHLIGSSFGDILQGSANNNSIRGNDGDDTINGGGGSGADAIFGETGNDLLVDGGGDNGDAYDGGSNTAAGDAISYAGQAGPVVVSLLSGVGRLNGASGDSYVNIENIIGGLGNDTLIGNGVMNTIVAGDGDDTVQGGDGADSLDGGTGSDWVDYRDSPTAVNVTLGIAGGQVSGGNASGDVLAGIEHLRGSNDETNGDTLASFLNDSTIDGALGDDTLIGDSFTATYVGGGGSDLVDYRLSDAGVIVNLETGQGQGGFAEDDVYLLPNNNGSGVENILGSTFNDTIIGVAGFNTFVGFAGNDVLFGASSRDLLSGDEGDDTINGGSGGDSIIGGLGDNDFADYTNDASQLAGVNIDLGTGRGSGGDAQGNDGFFDTLFGIEHVIGSGNNDSINGDDGVNWLFGASGVDALRGGGGNDSLFGGDGDDFLGGFAPGAVDTGADSLFGGTGNDAIFYDPNDAALVGGVGNDVLIGRSVADQIQLDAARFNFNGGFADIETFDLGDGNDVFLNTSSVSDLVNIGQGLNVFGGSGRDQISMRGAAGVFSGMDDNVDGGAGNDIIWGGFGNDSLSGGADSDQIYGGKGNDSFFGGSGFDVFYVGHDEGTDLIFDDIGETNGLVLFWGWDSTFGGNYDGIDPTEVSISYSGNDVMITLQNGGEIHFERSFNGSTWDTTVDILNLWDYGNGDAGNSPTPPTTFARDVWSATFDASTGTFTAFTLAVNG